MKSTAHLTAAAVAVAFAFAPALPASAQSDNRNANAATQLENWNQQDLYQNSWSADQMIGADVRTREGMEIGEVKDIIVGDDGTISKVVVEVGGFLEIGDQHIGVPWRDVRLGSRMSWISVPLVEVENGTYSLYGRIPQGENVQGAPGTWRVNELIGDYANLSDVPRYGLVADVLFNSDGKATAVVVDRARGPWGPYGYYAYPYRGYDAQARTYALPYASSQVVRLTPFDYRRFGDENPYANAGGVRFDRSARSQMAQDRKARMINDRRMRSFNALDKNDDGQLTRAEITHLPGVARNFAAADKDNDMALNRNEFDNLKSMIRSRGETASIQGYR